MEPKSVDPQLLQQLAHLYLIAQAKPPASARPYDAGERVQDVYASLNRDMHSRCTRLADYYKEHINTSKEAILRGCQGLSGHALIVGIGNGAEIPLEALCRQFDKVTVQDIDKEAVARALQTIPASLREKVVVVEGDLTGCVANFAQFLNTKEKLPLSELLKEASNFFNSSVPKRLGQLPEHQFDYVVSSCVSTQLGSIMWTALQDFVKTEHNQPCCPGNDLPQAISACAVRCITQHLLDLASWVKPEGKVYYSDTKDEIPLIRPKPGVVPVKDDEPKHMINQDALKAGLEPFQEQFDFAQYWSWYAFVPDNYAGAKGSAFHVMAMVMKLKNKFEVQ
ncbi:MAG: hypothetical protein LLG04_09260 [Parachlamydia sp.]|nr:hypothetical protein [Parachlamydia sp.]